MKSQKTWHEKHEEALSAGDKIADAVADGMGSWKFIIWQTIVVIIWMSANVIGLIRHWDPYPFILLNLMLSFQAAYTGPVLLMAGNRQSEIDRDRAIENLELDRQDHYDLLVLAQHVDKHFNNLHIKMEHSEDLLEDLQKLKERLDKLENT